MVGWLVVLGWVLVVVVGGGVVVALGGCVGGGGAGTTVTVVLSPGAVTVTVCDVCGGGGSFGGVVLPGLDFVCSRLIASKMATSIAAPAPTTPRTRTVRLYHGSRASCVS